MPGRRGEGLTLQITTKLLPPWAEKAVFPHLYPSMCSEKRAGAASLIIFDILVSSGSAGWFEEDLSLLDTQRALWLKPQSYFPTIPGKAKVLSPKRWATCHHLCLN